MERASQRRRGHRAGCLRQAGAGHTELRRAFGVFQLALSGDAQCGARHAAGRSRRGKYADALAHVSPEDAPAEQEDAATASQLWAAVRRLPEKQRDAVLLVYAEEMSHAEAGEIMGCKEATVSWHIHEAKKTLRGLL